MDGFELEDLLFSIKSYSETMINRLLGPDGTVWQKRSYDHLVRDPDELERLQTYIASNPGKANLNDGEYCLRSAKYVLDQ